jgi:hypothetical protein
VFLGRWANFDLYFCERADGGTALARYGNDGPEYSSMMVDYTRMHAEEKVQLNNISAIRVAALIAEDAGLLKRKLKEPHAKGFRIIDRRTLQASEVIESSRHAYREACKDCSSASVMDCEHNCPREVVVIISGGTNG